MAKKGQKFKTYSFELKKKAIEMKLRGIPHAKIAEELGIQDVVRLKIWMKKYRDLCEYLGVSRSGYYRYLSKKNKPDQDEELAEKIRYIYQLRNKIYGYRRIQAELLRLYGLRVNHKKVLRIMQKLGIQAVIRRKRLYQNQYRTPMGVRIAENLLNRHFHADAPNQKWVTDVTWIRAGNQTLYLSVIMDLFNLAEKTDDHYYYSCSFPHLLS